MLVSENIKYTFELPKSVRTGLFQIRNINSNYLSPIKSQSSLGGAFLFPIAETVIAKPKTSW